MMAADMEQEQDYVQTQLCPPHDSEVLTPTEAMRLLASVGYGRMAFCLNALPAIRPVNHLIDDGHIIIGTRLTSSPAHTHYPQIVAYGADEFDPRTRTGWSVAVTGQATIVDDPDLARRYDSLLEPWVNSADTAISIQPRIICGFRIT
jgi:hypothetical protein